MIDLEEFVNRFPINNIHKISLDQYVIGKESKESFCYILERKLRKLGNFLGAPVWKFKVYFNKNINDYESTQDYGVDYKTAFTKVKKIHTRFIERLEGRRFR
ncbi:MAG: hypothetical protein ACTSUC_01810 [Promethearchaeota archaeon]